MFVALAAAAPALLLTPGVRPSHVPLRSRPLVVQDVDSMPASNTGDTNGATKCTRAEHEAMTSIGGGFASKYGEITERGFRSLAERIRLGPDDVFVDCGSGLGLSVSQAAREFGVRRAYGVEFSASRHDLAVERLAVDASGRDLASRVRLIQGDCADESLWADGGELSTCNPNPNPTPNPTRNPSRNPSPSPSPNSPAVALALTLTRRALHVHVRLHMQPALRRRAERAHQTVPREPPLHPLCGRPARRRLAGRPGGLCRAVRSALRHLLVADPAQADMGRRHGQLGARGRLDAVCLRAARPDLPAKSDVARGDSRGLRAHAGASHLPAAARGRDANGLQLIIHTQR